MNRGKPPRQSGKPGSAQPRAPIPNSAFRISPAVPRAHKRLCRRSNRPNAAFRRRAIHDHARQKNASPRQRGTPPRRSSGLLRARTPASASSTSGEQFPSPARANTPAVLHPAGTNAAPTRNSRSRKAEKRIAASARNTAPPIKRPSPRAHSRQRILHVRRAISAPRAQTLLPVCIRRAQTPRRRAIHDHVRQKNAAPRQRGKSA